MPAVATSPRDGITVPRPMRQEVHAEARELGELEIWYANRSWMHRTAAEKEDSTYLSELNAQSEILFFHFLRAQELIAKSDQVGG